MTRPRILTHGKKVRHLYDGRFGPGKCGLCGTPLEGRQRRWCADCPNVLFYLQTPWELAKKIIRLRSGDSCEACGRKMPDLDIGEGFWVVDHIIPVAEGGPALNPENLQFLCPKCNDEKTRKDLSRILTKRPDPLANVATLEAYG